MKILDVLKKPVVVFVLGFILGLIIGLPVLGWGLMPVQWTKAAAQHLRVDAQQDYLRMTIDSYLRNKDKALALARWQELGPNAPAVLEAVKGTPKSLSAKDVEKFAALVGAPLAPAAGATAQPAQPGETPAATEAAPAGGGGFLDGIVSSLPMLALVCVLVLVVVAALVYLLVLSPRRKKGSGALGASGGTRAAAAAQEANRTAEKTDYVEQGHEPPVAQFMTTYVSGDDLYDESFSIDSPGGEFLGECGVGISETIGVGEKKVTAFEVWLFDKNDIQTVTKVLMSEHAFNDPNMQSRLASKGEPVAIDPGKTVVLETATLQMVARVVDMTYGKSALPANSFFDRMTLELAIWQRPQE